MKKLFILCFILIGSRAHSQIITPENLTEINAVLYYDGIDHDTTHHKYGYSGTKIFVGGYSSGGHLAALITMDGQYMLQEGLSKNQIAGVIPISGTYDIHHYYQVLSEANDNEFANNHIGSVFGLTMENFEVASPTSFIDSLSTSMLLISDTNTFRYTRLFEDRLREAGYDKLDVVHVHRLNHGELWRDLSFSEKSMYRDMIIFFIKNTPAI